MADFPVQVWSRQAVTYDNPLFLADGKLADCDEDPKTFPNSPTSVTAMSSQFVAAASSWPSDRFTQVCFKVSAC